MLGRGRGAGANCGMRNAECGMRNAGCGVKGDGGRAKEKKKLWKALLPRNDWMHTDDIKQSRRVGLRIDDVNRTVWKNIFG